MKIEWGNAAQWASAIAAVVVAGLAVYGVFFSATSQALVSFLQSELAVRNMRIAILETRERDLQVSINAAQSNLNGLSEKKAELEKQVAILRAEQDKFSKRVQELIAALSGTEFSLAREKLSARIASGFSALTVHRINIVSDWLRPEGVRAESILPWNSYLDHLKRSVEELPEQDRALARTVIDKFTQQCSRFTSLVIHVPAMRIPQNENFANYGFNQDKHPIAIRAADVAKQIENAENEIDACFKMVAP